MKRSVNEYDKPSGGGMSSLAYVPPAVGLGGMAFAKKKQIEIAQEAGEKDRREAAAEMKREVSRMDKGKTAEYKHGGAVSASKRADGIAQRGKTRGKFI